jgi:hypothetical protein
VRERLEFWWRALRLGTRQVNAAAGWAGTIFLALGIAGIAVPLVFHLSHWLIAVILVSLLVLVTAEGGYQVWHESDEDRKTAQAERDAARDDDRRDVRNRSVAAAERLASLVAELDLAVGNWEESNQNSVSEELKTAYNNFAVAQAAAAGKLTDPELQRRVRTHYELTAFCLRLINNHPEYRQPVAGLLRDHVRSISCSLEAHQRGADLPEYDAPPLKVPVDLTTLFAWRSGL